MKVVKVYSLKKAYQDSIVCPKCNRKPMIKIMNTCNGPLFFLRCINNHSDFFSYGSAYSLSDAVCDYNESVRANLDKK